MPLGLHSWVPAHSLPAECTRNALAEAIRRADGDLRPVGFEAFCVLMDRMTMMAVAFNIPVGSIDAVTKLYSAAFSSVPEDLLEKAVGICVSSWKWGNRLPMPGELLAFVSAELSERVRTRSILGMAKSKLDRREEERQEAEKRAAGDRLDEDFRAKHGLSTAAAKAEWRRRQGLTGEPKNRGEILDAIKGAMTIYAAGFEPPPPVGPAPGRSLGSSINRALDHLKQNMKDEAQLSSETASESVPKKMAENCAIACAIGFLLFGTPSRANDFSDLHGTAIALPMAKNGRVDKSRVDKTLSINYHRVLYYHPDPKLPPSKVARRSRAAPSAHADTNPPPHPFPIPKLRPPDPSEIMGYEDNGKRGV